MTEKSDVCSKRLKISQEKNKSQSGISTDKIGVNTQVLPSHTNLRKLTPDDVPEVVPRFASCTTPTPSYIPSSSQSSSSSSPSSSSSSSLNIWNSFSNVNIGKNKWKVGYPSEYEFEIWQNQQHVKCNFQNALNVILETFLGSSEIQNNINYARNILQSSQFSEEDAIQMAIKEHGLHERNTINNIMFRLQFPESLKHENYTEIKNTLGNRRTASVLNNESKIFDPNISNLNVNSKRNIYKINNNVRRRNANMTSYENNNYNKRQNCYNSNPVYATATYSTENFVKNYNKELILPSNWRGSDERNFNKWLMFNKSTEIIPTQSQTEKSNSKISEPETHLSSLQFAILPSQGTTSEMYKGCITRSQLMSDKTEHIEFMEAAVSVAIEEKGLTISLPR